MLELVILTKSTKPLPFTPPVTVPAVNPFAIASVFKSAPSVNTCAPVYPPTNPTFVPSEYSKNAFPSVSTPFHCIEQSVDSSVNKHLVCTPVCVPKSSYSISITPNGKSVAYIQTSLKLNMRKYHLLKVVNHQVDINRLGGFLNLFHHQKYKNLCYSLLGLAK